MFIKRVLLSGQTRFLVTGVHLYREHFSRMPSLFQLRQLQQYRLYIFFFPFIRRPWSRNDKELSLLPANRLHCHGFAVNIGEDATCWTCTCFLISRLCFYSLQPCALHTKHVTVGDIFTGISLPKSKSYIQSYTPAHFILTPWPRDDRRQE